LGRPSGAQVTPAPRGYRGGGGQRRVGALGDAHDGAAGARVDGDLVGAGAHARERAQQGGCGLGKGHAAVHLGARMAHDEPLDDPVFQRVETDHHETPSGLQHAETRRQRLRELVKLAVDENPNSLERACRRMLARFAGLDRASHELRQLQGSVQGAAGLPARDNRLCNGDSKPFFAVVTNHLRDLTLASLRQPLSRALAPRRVHAHVQRADGTKRKTPRGVVDLG
jgi:hypothetical protein